MVLRYQCFKYKRQIHVYRGTMLCLKCFFVLQSTQKCICDYALWSLWTIEFHFLPLHFNYSGVPGCTTDYRNNKVVTTRTRTRTWLKDQDQDFSDKDQDKVKDLTFKDEDKDKDFKFVLKDSLRTRTNITDCMVSLLKTRYWTIRKSTTSIYEEAAWT